MVTTTYLSLGERGARRWWFLVDEGVGLVVVERKWVTTRVVKVSERKELLGFVV